VHDFGVTHLYIKENTLYFQEQKQEENIIIYLQANKTHTVSIPGKKKHTPSPHINKNIYSHKNMFTFQTTKNLKEMHP
jgi:hypothetical protein